MSAGSLTIRRRPPGCAVVARELGEHRRGTAAVTDAWLLIEQPGSWARDVIAHSDADPGAGAELERRAAAAGVRVALIRRRAGRYDASMRHAYLAHAGRPSPWMEEFRFADPVELLGLDLGAARLDRPSGQGRLLSEPLYIVCTHGRKDACCAEFGRPVMRALRHRGLRVWESSHVGGDRFAANMVCLPHGVYYGRVEADSADLLIDHFDQGSLSLTHLRGRSCDDQLVQAADHLVREAVGATGVDDVVPTGWARRDDGDYVVVLDHLGARLHARLRSAPEPVRLTTCEGEEGQPDHYRLIEITRTDHDQ